MATMIPPTAAPSTLQDAVRKLAIARSAEAAAKAALQAKQDAFATENAALIATGRAAKESVAQAEADVRALASAAFTQTGERKPAVGVEIKVTKGLDYDPEKAFAWAKATKMALIPEQLDVKAFEKIASVTDIDFVGKVEHPKVFIASDLEKALAAADLTAPAAAEPAAAASPEAPVAPTVDEEDPFA